MGSLYKFTCSECNYNAEVSGGRDRGMLGFSETVMCLDCKNLSDVGTSKVVDCTADGREIFQSLTGKCRHCGSTNITPWDGKTCPQCGGKMVKGECTVMWD